MLGGKGMWTGFVHLLGRSVSFWRQETSRLYVQAKLADEGELCPLDQVGDAVQALCERMALLGSSPTSPRGSRASMWRWTGAAGRGREAPPRRMEGCRPPNASAHWLGRGASLDRVLQGSGE